MEVNDDIAAAALTLHAVLIQKQVQQGILSNGDAIEVLDKAINAVEPLGGFAANRLRQVRDNHLGPSFQRQD
jgi:hypothetical protein